LVLSVTFLSISFSVDKLVNYMELFRYRSTA